MKPNQFVKEINYLFSNSYLNSIDNEYPMTTASQKANRKFTFLLKSLFPDCEITTIKGSFCDSYGYVRKDGHCVFISFGDYRNNCFLWENNILIRTADPEGKTRDGSNHNITDINELQKEVYSLLKKNHIPAW